MAEMLIHIPRYNFDGVEVVRWLDNNIGYRDMRNSTTTWRWYLEDRYFAFVINDNFKKQAVELKLRFG